MNSILDKISPWPWQNSALHKITDGGGRIICRMNTGLPPATLIVDARLIAAAPMMLRALEMVCIKRWGLRCEDCPLNRDGALTIATGDERHCIVDSAINDSEA